MIMLVPDDVKCKICRKVFCCAQCRYKHEVKYHAIVVRKVCDMLVASNESENNTSAIYMFCPICESKPLVLHADMHGEMLIHIENNHLPMQCRKCAKVYNKIDDLREFSKCLTPVEPYNMQKCNSGKTYEPHDPSKTTTKNSVAHTTISTQTSPMSGLTNDTNLITPISLINLRWKVKNKITHEEITTDSVSSIRNLSSISNSSIRRSIDIIPKEKGKIVRSTSTPLPLEVFFLKPKEQTFNGSSGQVSSIYNSGCDLDNSPALTYHLGTTPRKSMENVNRLLRTGGRPKVTALTPLHHVMSKSIRKAFAEHGRLPSENSRGIVINRNKMFDSSDGSSLELPSSSAKSVMESPLDFRTTPARRRANSESVYATRSQLEHDVLLSSKKTTTKSIVITRLTSVETKFSDRQCSLTSNSTNQSRSTNGSIYKTCSSVEILTSTTEMNDVNVKQKTDTIGVAHSLDTISQKPGPHNSLAAITPITRIPGSTINKKIIKFETPAINPEESKLLSPGDDIPESIINKKITKFETPAINPEPSKLSSPGDVFFTPDATPVRKTSSLHKSDSDDVKLVAPRNLRKHFSPSRRQPLRVCAKNPSFNRIEDIVTMNENCDSINKNTENTWSLASLVSSVIRLPSLKGSPQKRDGHVASNSIIRRCASIAGSLLSRPKSLLDEEQLKTLKRKRTNTADYYSTNLSPQFADSRAMSLEDYSSVSSKRIRIQGRKPIERMRKNS